MKNQVNNVKKTIAVKNLITLVPKIVLLVIQSLKLSI